MKKVIAVLALVLAAGAALFFLNRPPAPFDPAELTPAETANPYPGEVYLLCQTVSSPNSLTLWFLNHTDQTFYHGDPPDRMSLQVLLDDLWYNVPHREYSTAGEGTVTGPGEKFIPRRGLQRAGEAENRFPLTIYTPVRSKGGVYSSRALLFSCI